MTFHVFQVRKAYQLTAEWSGDIAIYTCCSSQLNSSCTVPQIRATKVDFVKEQGKKQFLQSYIYLVLADLWTYWEF